jgi:hypothetical protein
MAGFGEDAASWRNERDRAERRKDTRREPSNGEDIEPQPWDRSADGGGGPKPPRFPLVKFDDVLLTTTSFYRVTGCFRRMDSSLFGVLPSAANRFGPSVS